MVMDGGEGFILIVGLVLGYSSNIVGVSLISTLIVI